MRVAVIGGGPCGLLLGSLLARSGLEAAIFEEHASLGVPRHCTGLVSESVFDAYGIDREVLLDEFYGGVLHYGSSSVYLPFKQKVVAVDREQFEGRLGETAAELGARLELGKKVVDVKRSRGLSVLSTLSSGGKEREDFEAELAVDCSGASGGLLGLQYEVEAEKGPKVPHVFFEREVPREYFYWVVPQGGRRFLVGTAASAATRVKLDAFMSSHELKAEIQVTKILRAFGGRVVVDPPGSPFSREFPHALLAGDAGNQVKLTTGGGLIYAAESARALASALTAGKVEDYLSWFGRKRLLIRRHWLLRQVYVWLPPKIMKAGFSREIGDYVASHPLLYDEHWEYFRENAPALASLLARSFFSSE